MRTWTGWALAVLGLLVAVLGAAVMVVLGPDSRFTTGPHAIETDSAAVVTAPRTISWANVQVDILAEVPARKPVFVGIGNAVDVQDLVGTTQRLEVTGFRRPWGLTTREVEGVANLPGSPPALDWWIESADGLGGASISTQLPDQTASIAILSVGSSNLSGLQVSLAYGVKGGFAKGAALVLLGLGVLLLGLVVRRGPAAPDAADVVDTEPDVVEEVVYVYVDDDGVEHEITPQEAAELDVVVEETAEVRTAGQIAAAEPQRVVYVFVDDDGVEHEVDEDELAEFEIVDDEPQDRT
jgi:hypothetical protein